LNTRSARAPHLYGRLGVRRLRRALVAAQFAIATPLLVVAGLLLVSLSELRQVDLGFDTRNVITGAIQLPAAAYYVQQHTKDISIRLALTTRASPYGGRRSAGPTMSQQPRSWRGSRRAPAEESPPPRATRPLSRGDPHNSRATRFLTVS
jgi:hypothetical protein